MCICVCVCIHFDAATGLSSSLSISVTADVFPFLSKCLSVPFEIFISSLPYVN